LSSGSISAFNFANNIQTMPTVVFGTSFATAVFPTLTLSISSQNPSKFSYYLNRSIRTIIYLLVPISVIFILLRAQIIRLILGSGNFNWSDTTLTAQALAFFSLSLVAQGLIPLFAKSFYAACDTKTPMYASIYTVILSVVLGYIFSKYLGLSGLVLAFSIGSFFNACLLYTKLLKNPSYVIDYKLFSSLAKTIIITLVMAVTLQVSKHFFKNYVNMSTFVGVLEQTLASLAVALVMFLGLSLLFGCEELKWAISKKVNGGLNNVKEQE